MVRDEKTDSAMCNKMMDKTISMSDADSSICKIMPTSMKSHPNLMKSMKGMPMNNLKLYAIVMASVCTEGVLINHYLYHKNNVWDTSIRNNILFFSLIICQLLNVFIMETGAYFKSEVIFKMFKINK